MGSRSESNFQLLQPDAIRASLAAKGFSDHVLLYESTTTSTNADVLKHYDNHQQLAIAICESQTAGKGRRGRQWHSPYAQNIYLNIFRKFSHFPINLSDINIKGEGKTITYLALVVYNCFNSKRLPFLELYRDILNLHKSDIQSLFLQDITVDTFLGCILYYHSPIDIKSALSDIKMDTLFTTKQLKEYKLKKKTIMLYIL